MPEKEYKILLTAMEIEILKLALKFLQANISGAEKALNTTIYECDVYVLEHKVSCLDKK